jgi:hypothetical protein
MVGQRASNAVRGSRDRGWRLAPWLLCVVGAQLVRQFVPSAEISQQLLRELARELWLSLA